MRIILLTLLLACSTPEKKIEADDKCLKLVEQKKFVAPNDVKSLGTFSNVVSTEDGLQGYKLRIIKRRQFCETLIMEFDGGLEPQTYAISNLFECEDSISTLSLFTKLGFLSPYGDSTPEDFYFGFDGKRNSKDELIGFITFPANDLKDRPEKTRVKLKLESKDEFSMAGFDWQIIQKFKQRMRCYY